MSDSARVVPQSPEPLLEAWSQLLGGFGPIGGLSSETKRPT